PHRSAGSVGPRRRELGEHRRSAVAALRVREPRVRQGHRDDGWLGDAGRAVRTGRTVPAAHARAAGVRVRSRRGARPGWTTAGPGMGERRRRRKYRRRRALGHGLRVRARGPRVTPASAASIQELNEVLAATPFLEPYGFTVKACAPGECTLAV